MSALDAFQLGGEVHSDKAFFVCSSFFQGGHRCFSEYIMSSQMSRLNIQKSAVEQQKINVRTPLKYNPC